MGFAATVQDGSRRCYEDHNTLNQTPSQPSGQTMSAAAGARLLYLRDGKASVRFPFDRWVVESIKAQIPSECRSYEPLIKTWFVGPGWGAVVEAILCSAFDDVAIEYETDSYQRSEPTPIRKTDPEFAALYLLPGAPAEVVRAVYRTLARLNHPDKGGDTARMQEINAAFETLQKRGVA